MTDLFLRSYGTGPRPAVALHCSLAHGGEWAGVMAHLGDRITLIAPDLPGHGRSPGWTGPGDFIAGCAAAILPLFDGPRDLIGHSGGAVAALQLALAAPGMVRTLTLIEPTLFAATRGTPAWTANVALFEPFETAFDAGAREQAAQLFMNIWGSASRWDMIEPRLRDYAMARIHLIRAAEPALLDDAGAILAPGRLEGLPMPVMFISGDRSPPVIAALTDVIAARVPDVGVATVPGAGHMCPVTHPAEVAGLIAANLDRA